MTFFVAVHQQLRPDLLDAALATIRNDFATSRQVHPGRINTRLFQHVDDPAQMLAVGEWASREDYERLRRTPSYQAVTERADPPATIDYLQRLSYVGRMHLRATVAAGASITAPAEHAEAFARFLTTEDRRRTIACPGLVSHEVYSIPSDPRRTLVLHTWVSMDALQQFRRSDSPELERAARPFETSGERFTGTLTAEVGYEETRGRLAVCS